MSAAHMNVHLTEASMHEQKVEQATADVYFPLICPFGLTVFLAVVLLK